MLAIRQEANAAVADGVVRKRPRLAGSRGHEHERSAFGWFRNDPFVIGRDSSRQPFTNSRRRRAIGIAQEYGVIRPAAIAFFFEDDLMAVPADVALNRPSEPTQFALFFFPRRQSANPNPFLMRDHQSRSVPQILDPNSSRHVCDRPQLS